MDFLWMTIVGGLTGLLASIFVKGSDAVGFVWIIILGAFGYGLGGGLVYALGGSVVLQWIVGIVVTALFLGGYIWFANNRSGLSED
mgnify:FL=1